MLLDFGREVCGDLETAEKREWLVTNGIGGFASGTVAGMLTRRYHGLLIAALQPPLGRTLLVTKLDETAEYDGIYPESGRFYPLFNNRWSSGTVEPNGHHHLNRFHLEGTTPVWTFACANALLEKRIWMQSGANTTYVQYRLARATGPLTLEAKTFINYRDYHSTTMMNEWQPRITAVSNGLHISMFNGATPFSLLSNRGEWRPQFDWYEDFFLSIEEYRGQNDVQEDHLYGALLRVTLQPGESVTVVASTATSPQLDGDVAYAERQGYEQTLLEKARGVGKYSILSTQWAEKPMQQLVLAADQFIVKRATGRDENGRTIIAGYPWFSDWGRDTMIALPGLALATGRPDVAAGVLRTFARFASRGMLPNRFPDAGEAPDYNTVDATLWFFHALDAYLQATDDDALARDLYETLVDIVDWHRRGTRFAIGVDPEDGLVRAGRPGTQLTWMDAKTGDHAFTPRVGKPVEVNALWHHALRVTAAIAARVGDTPAAAAHAAAADRTAASFRSRFWNAAGGYLFDVVDGPAGVRQPDGRLADPALRPNQIIAVALPSPLLAPEAARAVVDACARHLFTSHGLRSLAPGEPAYAGRYAGDPWSRDAAYHQGTAWAWLLGPFVRAHHRVYGDPDLARSFLDGIAPHLAAAGLGSIGEVFDGDAPFRPGGCPWQAWSVAEVLYAYRAVASPPL
ncbi:glycogen debranching protein [bacterium]|nr:MAG: glycogen debranching protein [bacterium]